MQRVQAFQRTGKRGARLAIQTLPDWVDVIGWLSVAYKDEAGPPRDRVHSRQKWADLADAVDHMRADRHVTWWHISLGPAFRHDLDAGVGSFGQPLLQVPAHGGRWLDRDDVRDLLGKIDRVAARAGADVKHGI